VSTVRWSDSLRTAVDGLGVRRFVEISPAPVLSAFVRQTQFRTATTTAAAAAAGSPTAGAAAGEAVRKDSIESVTLHDADSIVAFLKAYKG
jgi:malonyl CoA-acyl carrier protein transacylase